MASEPVDLDYFVDQINLEMFVYKNRLSTYEGKWVYNRDANATCTSERMARAGFYCTGKKKNASDSARCYVCQHELYWDAEDNPWEEHKKHRPDCELVKMGKQDEEEHTVSETLRLIAYAQSTTKHKFASESIDDLCTLMNKLLANTEKLGRC